MAAAYDALPEATKKQIAGLKAMHVYQSKHSTRKLMTLGDEAKKRLPPAVYHPIVRTHPENGRKAIYINPIRIETIAGMKETDAQLLLCELLQHAIQERFQYRHKWNRVISLCGIIAVSCTRQTVIMITKLKHGTSMMTQGDKPF